MDLNQLYFRHGVSLMRARAATSSRIEIAQQMLAETYSRRIGYAFPAGERQRFWNRSEAAGQCLYVNRVSVVSKSFAHGVGQEGELA